MNEGAALGGIKLTTRNKNGLTKFCPSATSPTTQTKTNGQGVNPGHYNWLVIAMARINKQLNDLGRGKDENFPVFKYKPHQKICESGGIVVQ